MRLLRPTAALLVLVGLAISAVALHQGVFWTLPCYHVDRIAVELEARVRATVFPARDGGYCLSFVPGMTDYRLAKGIEIASPLPLRAISTVDIPGGVLTSKGYKPLIRLQGLRVLRIQECPVDGNGMKDIARVSGLRRLVLDNVPLDATTLFALREAQSLEELMVYADLPGRCLDLDDDALAHLCEIRNLKEISLFGMGVSNAEEQGMRARRPELKIRVGR